MGDHAGIPGTVDFVFFVGIPPELMIFSVHGLFISSPLGRFTAESNLDRRLKLLVIHVVLIRTFKILPPSSECGEVSEVHRIHVGTQPIQN